MYCRNRVTEDATVSSPQTASSLNMAHCKKLACPLTHHAGPQLRDTFGESIAFMENKFMMQYKQSDIGYIRRLFKVMGCMYERGIHVASVYNPPQRPTRLPRAPSVLSVSFLASNWCPMCRNKQSQYPRSQAYGMSRLSRSLM